MPNVISISPWFGNFKIDILQSFSLKCQLRDLGHFELFKKKCTKKGQIYKLSYKKCKKCDTVNDKGHFLCKFSKFDSFGDIKIYLHPYF
jgi:hypothetical protein